MPDVARTLDLPSGQRFEYWKHILTNTFVPLEVSTPGNGDDFRGRLRGCELGSLRFIEVSAEAHTARRTARLVKAAPAGCYKIGLQLRGSSVLIQDGREATLTPGDFTLYDTDRPYTLAFSDPHRMLVLVFPRDMLGLPEYRLAGLTATRLPGAAGGLATLIGPFLAQVADLLDEVDTRDLRVGVRLAGNVLDLLGTVLTERLDCTPPDPDRAHRALMARGGGCSARPPSSPAARAASAWPPRAPSRPRAPGSAWSAWSRTSCGPGRRNSARRPSGRWPT